MNAGSHHPNHDNYPSPHQNEGMGKGGGLLWAVTFFLLSLVSAIYAFGGTQDETGGLYGRVATVGFLVLALVMFFTRRSSGDGR
jgi:uncharacterized membrane protein YtjA (UPF0391 family)